jgi:DNA-binding winged helix-turn-helix (wHTH) protein/tetratricopeptide (TPR) repeat protein
MTSEPSLSFGPFRLDAATESIWRDGEEIRLRPRTLAVLRYLAERPGRVITKEELLQAVWGEVAVGDAALAVCVGEIRKALGDEARMPRFVETVHRRGYRFIGVVGAAAASAEPELPRLVGREAELARLRGWMERALRGERQIVFVTGEPGIGKSALVEAFLASLPGADEFWSARGQCLDHYGAGEAYLPILEALSRLARGPGGDHVVDVVGTRAPTWLAQIPGLVSPTALARLQGRILGATRERMLREMAEALEVLAAARPLVLLLEDLHWSDPSTLDLLAAVARRPDPARLLLIGTYRPVDVIVRGHPLRAVTRELALHGASHELPLELLGEADVGRYLTERFGSEIGCGLAPVVHRRSDGLPLFMVGVVDTLIAQDLLVETSGRWEVKGNEAVVQTAVPQSLRQMIEQQLTALPSDEQRLLEVASVTGTSFSAATLAAALEAEVEASEEHCEALVRREQFIRAAGVEEWPDGTVAARYRFLHVLYQQVLYERLPAARRASFHRRIAEREEAGYRARLSERAAVLALHFERGGRAAQAIAYHRQAAENALQRCAYLEAIEHLTRSREALNRVADTEQRLALELPVQTTLGTALIALHGAAAAEVETAYARASELAERLDDRPRLYHALWGLWYMNFGRGRYPSAREMGERLLELAERGQDSGSLLEAHHAMWATLYAMGESTAALPHLERGVSIYDPTVHGPQAFLYGGHDAGACCLSHFAVTSWLLGYPDRALARLHEAGRLAETLAHPMTMVITLLFAATIHYLRGDQSAALTSIQDMIARAQVQGSQRYIEDGAVILATFGISDRQGIAHVFRRLTSSPAPIGRSAWRDVMVLCFLGEVSVRSGDAELGLEALAAIPEVRRRGFFASEVVRIRGELLLARREQLEAERCFREALEIARRRSERSLELRAATSLARLLAHKGLRGEARQILGAIYAWFTEGFDTADLRAARRLLDDLESVPGALTSRLPG